LNVTPDSFSDRGSYFDRRAAVARGLEIEREGAGLLDIGGESTRPGAQPVEAAEEIDRTIPVIEALRRKGLRIPISIDTTKAAVADRALHAGAEIVNDVSGLRYDPGLAEVVRRHQAAVVLMHLRGTPRTMQKLPQVKNILPAIRRGLSASIRRALHAGIKKRRIVIDPGIGFGKNAGQNFEILKGLPSLTHLGYPILAGPSRKSFLRWALSNQSPSLSRSNRFARSRKAGDGVPEDLLFGTAAAVTAAILNGAHIVRVHDVHQMVTVARIADRIS
ncbi:MAG: dihydropteroate synthase, partial [Acidobacteriota bacterium]